MMIKRYFYIILIILIILPSVNINAQKEIDSKKLALPNLSSNEKAIELNKIGFHYIDSDLNYNEDSCLKYSHLAKNLAKNSKNKFQESYALNTIGIAVHYKQKYDSSLIYLFNALSVLSDIDSLILKSNIYGLIASNYYYLGDYLHTLEYLNKQLNIARKLEDKQQISICLNRLGIIHKNLDQYEKAIYFYQEALKLSEEHNDSADIAKALNNIGNIYFHNRGNYVQALEHYNRALEIYSRIGKAIHKADLLNNIGVLHMEQYENQSALNNFNEALSIFKSLDKPDETKIATTENNLGIVYAKLGNYQTALNYIQNSYEYYIGIEAKPKVAETLRAKGDIFLEWGKNQLALNSYFESYKIYTELGGKSDISELYHKLSETYAKLNNYKKAYEFHILSTDLNDSLFSEKVNKQIAEFQTLYETEKKDKEISLLNKDKALQDATLKRQKLAITFFIAGFVIISVFLILILRLFRQKQKANKALEEKNEKISLQRDHIFQQNKEITSSIEYASRIQTALLPPQELFDKIIPESFVLFKPRDIVSGDYYWLSQKGNKIISVTADCTGHGVPGAFMSMLGISFLNEIINVTNEEDIKSNIVLNEMRALIISSLRQTGIIGESRDGMDMTLCIIDKEKMELDFAGAYNPLYLFRNGELLETKPDKMPIGIHITRSQGFTNHIIKLKKGDILYTFSDGYVDQFGGEKNSKFRKKNFKELLLKIHNESMIKQKEILDQTIVEWMEGYEQIDDILVSGIKIS